MGKITDISVQKNNRDRYNLFIDDVFVCGLGADSLSKFYLYHGKEITEEILEEVIKNELRDYFFRRAAGYAARGYKTEKAIHDYIYKLLLKKKMLAEIFGENIVEKFDKNILIDNTLMKIKELKLVDDQVYAQEFVTSRLNTKPRGKRMIENELRLKGVNKEDIKATLEKFNVDEKSMITQLLEKKYHKTRLKYSDQKEINYLRGKGFDWDEISNFIDE